MIHQLTEDDNRYLLKLSKIQSNTTTINELSIDENSIQITENYNTTGSSQAFAFLDKNSLTFYNSTKTPVNTVAFYTDHITIDRNTELYYKDIATISQIPTTTSQLDNDSNFITNAALTVYATETWVGEQGYQTASDVSTALTGYATTSDVSTAVSTAISSQTKETWTFTLSDGSTVTKSIVLGA